MSTNASSDDRIKYWDKTYGSILPTNSAHAGIAIASLLPYALYNYVIPDEHIFLSGELGSFEQRLGLLFSLQVLPAMVAVFYIGYTGLTRIPYSPAAAHDPAAMYASNKMPIEVHAANRAFTNTLEQYLLLWTSSCALVLQLPANQLNLMPTLYLTWSICRVLYIVGYVTFGGSGRMIGFPGTVNSSFVALCYAIYLMMIK